MQELDTGGVKDKKNPTVAKYPYLKYLGKVLSGDTYMAVDL